nr:hypothetical protein [Tanacetum cinerariifolium]
MFIKYSKNHIQPKKSKGKGTKGKNTTDESHKTIDVSEESKRELAKKKTSSKRRVKKKVTLSADDNIISTDPDVALELAKSISQTKAKEEEAARKVHATHARIIIESVPDSAKKKSGGRSSKSVVIQDTPNTPKSKPATSKTKLNGAPSLTPQEQEVADIMQALKESKKTSRRQPGNGGSNKGTGSKPGVPDGSTVIFATSNHETESDANEIYKYKIRVRKDKDVEMKDVEVDDSDKGDEDITDAAKAYADKTSEVKDDAKETELLPSSSSLSVSLGNYPDLVSISIDGSVSVIPKTTNLPPISEIVTKTLVLTIVPSPQVTPIILTVQLTPTPISTPPIATDALTIITVVHESNALSTVDLRVAKLEKDVSELKTIDHSFEALVAALKEYDLKTSLYQSMHANKSFNRNPANHRLYHALMEALIEDEITMDKGVVDTIKDHKRKHDDDKDDDDEDPPARPNQSKKTKRRRTKESESLKKPSSTKDTPKGKTLTKGSKTGKSILVKEPVEESIAEVIMDDAGDDVVHDDDQPQDTLEPKTRKTLNPDWFKQPPRPPTPDSEWNKQKHDWNNLEGDCYPFDLSKPLLLQGPLGHRTIAADYLFNNDLEYLKTYDPKVTYTTSITKTKAARYEIKGIKDMVPTLWSTIKHAYDKNAEKGIQHWVKDANCGTDLRSDQQLYKFKEGDFVDLHLNDIEDMLLLLVQHKLFHVHKNVIVDFIVVLRMFKRNLILERRVEDLQLGVETYQKKLNITKSQKTFLEIKFKELDTPSYDPPGIIYEDLDKQKRYL